MLRAFTDGRRAVSAIERARAREPRRRETGLVLGISRYTVSIMSWPVRTLARLGGLSGDREGGLSLLREAASAGAETETDALLLLMIVDNREGRHEAALQRLARLCRLHPANRLWSLNMGATALAAGRFDQADVFLSEGITARRWISDPAILGETALWFAHRGAARARLLRSIEATADFERSLASAPRDWVRGRIHSELGDLALAAGDRAAASRHFTLAIVFAERGGDRMAEKDCKTKLSRVDHAAVDRAGALRCAQRSREQTCRLDTSSWLTWRPAAFGPQWVSTSELERPVALSVTLGTRRSLTRRRNR